MDYIIILQILLLVVSLCPLGFGVFGLLRERHIKVFGVETDAKVISFKKNSDTATPVVEYQTEEGVIRSKSWFAMSRELYSFDVGDTIRIRYNSIHIRRFRIVGSKLPIVMFSIVILMGIITLATAVFIPYIIIG